MQMNLPKETGFCLGLTVTAMPVSTVFEERVLYTYLSNFVDVAEGGVRLTTTHEIAARRCCFKLLLFILMLFIMLHTVKPRL